MYFETPVITTDCASIPEVVGDAAMMLSHDDDEAWKDAMLRILTDDACVTHYVELGRENIKRFSWRQCASNTVRVLEQALEAS